MKDKTKMFKLKKIADDEFEIKGTYSSIIYYRGIYLDCLISLNENEEIWRKQEIEHSKTAIYIFKLLFTDIDETSKIIYRTGGKIKDDYFIHGYGSLNNNKLLKLLEYKILEKF